MSSATKNRRKPAATSSTFQRAMRTLTRTLAVASLMSAPRAAANNNMRVALPPKRPSPPNKINLKTVSAALHSVKSNNRLRAFRNKGGEVFPTTNTSRSRYNPLRLWNYGKSIMSKNYRSLGAQNLKLRRDISGTEPKKAQAKLKQLEKYSAKSVEVKLNEESKKEFDKEAASIAKELNEGYEGLFRHFRSELNKTCTDLSCAKLIKESLVVKKKILSPPELHAFFVNVTSPSVMKKLNQNTTFVLGQFVESINSLYQFGNKNYTSARTRAYDNAHKELVRIAKSVEELDLKQFSAADIDIMKRRALNDTSDTFWYLYIRAWRYRSDLWISAWLTYLAGLVGAFTPLGKRLLVWAWKYARYSRNPKKLLSWPVQICNALIWYTKKNASANATSFGTGYRKVLNDLIHSRPVRALKPFFGAEILMWNLGKKTQNMVQASMKRVPMMLKAAGSVAGLAGLAVFAWYHWRALGNLIYGGLAVLWPIVDLFKSEDEFVDYVIRMLEKTYVESRTLTSVVTSVLKALPS